MSQTLLHWRDFFEELEQAIIERAAFRRMSMGSIGADLAPDLFESICQDEAWRLFPRLSQEFLLAQLATQKQQRDEQLMTVHADMNTWAAILDGEEAQDPAVLGRLAEDLYASLGAAEDRAGRLQAELYQAAMRRPYLPGSLEAPGRPYAVNEVVPPGSAAGVAGPGQLGH